MLWFTIIILTSVVTVGLFGLLCVLFMQVLRASGLRNGNGAHGTARLPKGLARGWGVCRMRATALRRMAMAAPTPWGGSASQLAQLRRGCDGARRRGNAHIQTLPRRRVADCAVAPPYAPHFRMPRCLHLLLIRVVARRCPQVGSYALYLLRRHA